MKTCFCDSISKTRQTDTLKEYLCYKTNVIYKLQVKEHSQRISRVRAGDSRWELEAFEQALNDSSKTNQSRYVIVKTDSLNYLLNYVGEDVDSLEILIFNTRDTLYQKFHRGHSASITKALLDNRENELAINRYSTVTMKYPRGTAGREMITINALFINSIKANYFVKHPLNTVLPNVKKCIDQNF